MSVPFDYHLPPDLIAQEPCEPRDHARLLVSRRSSASFEHRHIEDLPNLLAPGDLLVLNDTRVLHARLIGQRKKTGGRWEGLFLRALADGSWEMLCQTGGRPQPGEAVVVDSGALELILEEKGLEGRWRVRPLATGEPAALLERHGQVPLPPYIRAGQARTADAARYQTIYANHAGAVAAPTAGLHFTPELFARLAECGIDKTFVTLHVGLGTFQPIKVDDFREHAMHAEWGSIGAEAVAAIGRCQSRGGRVVAVGTTSVRVLESAARSGELQPWSGETNLFIYPPYRFRVVEGLLTNFHLPRTTLLLMVAALMGAERMEEAYRIAIAERYRFYSYG
ncbi:MAG: tRNA preQ1(34) S-adenosylmethionine ribosyltransferase-isomerase QueA, partial [Planctomycetota bacterium]